MFHNYLNVRQYGVWEGRTVWKHLSPMAWSVWNGFIGAENPLDFYTDFGSVPRHFHMYDAFGGRCNAPADGHDLLYRKGAQIFVDINQWPNIEFPEEAEQWLKSVSESGSGWYADFPQALSDYIFRQLMIEDGEPINIYAPMYLAVRAKGASSFHKFNVMDKLPCERIYYVQEIKI